MKKGRDLKNLPVIDLENGEILGYVEEISVRDNRQVTGFSLVSPNKEHLYLPLSDVVELGPDAIMTHGGIEIAEELSEKPKGWSAYAGSLVLTASGQTLGTVEDIVIEENDGHVIGYELSDGYVKDLVQGRKMIAAADIIQDGTEVVIIQEGSKGVDKP